MNFIESFSEAIGRWLGFVGSCATGPTGACIPFIAFFALAIAAAAALWLIVRAYQRLRGDSEADVEARREEKRRERAEAKLRRSIEARLAPRHVAHKGWRLPA